MPEDRLGIRIIENNRDMLRQTGNDWKMIGNDWKLFGKKLFGNVWKFCDFMVARSRSWSPVLFAPSCPLKNQDSAGFAMELSTVGLGWLGIGCRY